MLNVYLNLRDNSGSEFLERIYLIQPKVTRTY